MASSGPKVKIAPSILSADFSRLGEQVAETVAAGADYIHVDVMDGHFVPVLTVGPWLLSALRSMTDIPLDVHLLIDRPEEHITQFVQAGASVITVHAEACPHLHRAIQFIKDQGVKAGVVLNPGTPLSAVEEVLPMVDMVVALMVNVGPGKQGFIEIVLDKIARLRRMADEKGWNYEIEADGRISVETAPLVVRAGANVLVAGGAIYSKTQTVTEAMARLRESLP